VDLLAAGSKQWERSCVKPPDGQARREAILFPVTAGEVFSARTGRLAAST
jgi:hypothetical protein